MSEAPSQTAATGMDLHDPEQRSEVERALEALNGMVAVRLVAGFERPVDELHALVVEDRSPKQVVRDIQSLLYTRFDLSIDHRVISVVQLAEDDPIASAVGEHPARVALTRVSVTQAASHASVTVVVTDDDGGEHVGSTDCDVTPASQRSAAGAATMQAVEEVVAPATSLTLAGLEQVRCGGADVILAVVEVRAARTQLVLTGSALVRRGEIDAVARAVLDALNRILRIG